ncbi:SEC53 [Ecytonucleospora hepatopenaei]|uniref:Phosphomannomutase n=1 Tax=Ecytonucleospora hepatopenaei TaxID=646526 RepID=A0A1W0E407_9MICR|nr:SEC53 [Ecytonucleospora hepatopenaei]
MKTHTERSNTLFLFDIHGTLAENKQMADDKVFKMLLEIKKYVKIGFVTGSDLEQAKKQLGENVLNVFDYGFCENGTQFYKNGKLEKSENFLGKISEKGYKEIVNHVLSLLCKIDCPVKRGQFITLRNSTLNVSPIGRSCTVLERKEFFEYDKKFRIREKFVKEISSTLSKYEMDCAIGGQISIDIFPKGWDKTYCINHITEENICFFGDMTEIGQNDYKLYNHPKTKGFKVLDPHDTIKKVYKLLFTN